MDDVTPVRGRYPYALVIATKPCKDGRVRSATVRTSDGLIRDRDIRKLVLIESAAAGSNVLPQCDTAFSFADNQLDDASRSQSIDDTRPQKKSSKASREPRRRKTVTYCRQKQY